MNLEGVVISCFNVKGDASTARGRFLRIVRLSETVTVELLQ